jgi:hypothetical protein
MATDSEILGGLVSDLADGAHFRDRAGYVVQASDEEIATLRKYAAIARAVERFDVDGLYRVLGEQQQCDEDGVMCIVSRQAVDEARQILIAAAPQFQEE